MHQIEYKAAKLEAEKLQMANESTRVYEEYLNELERTKIQYSALSADGSITYNDASYLDLMSGKSGTPYLLYTTGSEKVCLSEELVNMYNSSSSASDFVEKMKNYQSTGSRGSSTWWSNTNGTGGTTPPSGGGTTPPSGGGTTPPPSGGQTPPPIGGETPPPSGGQTPPPSGGETPPSEYDYQIVRKGSSSITISANQNDKVLYVKDDLLGDKYYTISTGSSSITCEILDNGRLYIKGDNATISEKTSQKDNIILVGNNNNVSTGDQDDTIRVGYVGDSLRETEFNSTNLYGNVIDAGAGNDYIENRGINVINGGSGQDTLYDLSNILTNNDGVHGSIPGTPPLTIQAPVNCEVLSNTYENNTDNTLEWGRQGGYGDCQTLSCIYSICNQGKYNEFFSVTPSGSGWNVTFKKSGTTQYVSAADIKSESASTDKDLAVIEAAFRLQAERKGFSIDESGTNKVGSSSNFWVVGNIIYGSAQYHGGYQPLEENSFKYLVQQYNSGNITNLIVGSSQDASEANPKLGIMEQHAYAVKSVDMNKSVTLVNPHDMRDEITLDWNDFFDYFHHVVLVGDTYENYKNHYGNVYYDNVLYHSSSVNDGECIYFGDDASRQDLYMELYNVIGQAIASNNYELIPGDMVNNKSFLINAIQSGAVYLKEPDKTTGQWVGTSVSIATKLREVSDESNLKKAEAKYEADMKKIDRKDRKYDQDLAALDAERNAVKNEMETLKTVAKENVDRTFKLFS